MNSHWSPDFISFVKENLHNKEISNVWWVWFGEKKRSSQICCPIALHPFWYTYPSSCHSHILGVLFSLSHFLTSWSSTVPKSPPSLASHSSELSRLVCSLFTDTLTWLHTFYMAFQSLRMGHVSHLFYHFAFSRYPRYMCMIPAGDQFLILVLNWA